MGPSDIDRFQLDAMERHDVVVSPWECLQELNKIKSFACGPDGISGRYYKIFAEELAYPLSAIFSHCLQACTFPVSWKLANIIALPKTDGGLRPISLLPAPGKLLEKFLLRKVIIPSMSKSFDSKQFAFIPSKWSGCSAALTVIRQLCLTGIDQTNAYVRLLAIDFTKAFDKASHFQILEALKNEFQCSSSAISMIHDFLSNRSQRVLALDGLSSSWKPLTSGVPQGSVLGPFLFAILIDSLTPILPNSRIICYADDTTVMHSVGPGETDNLQQEINHIQDWCSSKSMMINSKKTKLLTITRSNILPPTLPFSISGEPLEECTQIKLLGVMFQSNTKWDEHFKHIFHKACRGQSMVRKLWLDGLPSNGVWSAFYAFVASHLFYAFPAICDLPVALTRKFANLEKAVSRWSRVEPREKLTVKLDKICISMIHDIMKYKDHPLNEFFTRREETRTLRNHRVLHPKNVKCKSIQAKSLIRFYTAS
jgi:hypothetical protein